MAQVEQATAIIMAGGDSTRMKTDKSRLPVGDRTLIEHVVAQIAPHFDQVLISAKTDDAFQFPNVEIVPDEVPGQGPLRGIVSAMKRSRHTLNFIQACDIPNTDLALVRKMLRHIGNCHAITPRNPSGRCEPLYTVYHISVLPIMEAMLARGQKSVHKVFDQCRARYVDLPEENTIWNLNTIEDYQRYLEND